jgi:phenylacetate-CoA ligase
MTASHADETRAHWLEVLAEFQHDRDAAGTAGMWSPRLDGASRDEITAIQNAKLAAMVPFLYENSGFYRRRFDRLGLTPSDVSCVDDLPK